MVIEQNLYEILNLFYFSVNFYNNFIVCQIDNKIIIKL
jgi:hypothetical protein